MPIELYPWMLSVVGGGCEASFGIAPLADAVLRIRYAAPPPTQSSRRQKVVCNM